VVIVFLAWWSPPSTRKLAYAWSALAPGMPLKHPPWRTAIKNVWTSDPCAHWWAYMA
jgi:hypothetical protein